MICNFKYRLTMKATFFLLTLILYPFYSNTQVLNVWAVSDGEKVFKFDTDHFAKDNNSIWDGEKISLRGLYNEVLGFQVIVEVDSTGANGLEISMSAPVHKKSGTIIAGSGAVKYGDHGYMDFF